MTVQATLYDAHGHDREVELTDVLAGQLEGVDDSYAAVEWVRDHGGEQGLNPARLAVGGDSAGGYLTAVIAQMARDRSGPSIALQVMIYPAVGTRGGTKSADLYASGYFFSKAELAWIYAQYVDDAAAFSDPRVQPILATRFDHLPPALIILPQYDIMRDDGVQYAEQLKAAGVPTDLHIYAGTIHGFANMGGAIPAGRQAVDEVSAKLKAALTGQRPR